MSTLFDIKGRVVLVTGSNRGNGLGIAQGIRDAGATVLRLDRAFDSDIGADDWTFDLSNLAGIPALVAEMLAKHGKIDALVNNAGISLASDTPYTDKDAYDKTLTVNLHAAFALCVAVCPIMAAQGKGSIINITSLGAELGFPGNPSYQIAKAGLRQLTKAIAFDWGDKGIRANNICPGYIHTAMTDKSYNDPVLHEQRKRRMMLPRWGEPADLAGPAIFLISDASAYITADDIHVDGGWTSKGL